MNTSDSTDEVPDRVECSGSAARGRNAQDSLPPDTDNRDAQGSRSEADGPEHSFRAAPTRQRPATKKTAKPLSNEKPSVALEIARGLVGVGGVPRYRVWSNDIQEFGCIVRRESPKRLTLLEPLSYTAPSIARPYCCYLNTVIFYVSPHQLDRSKTGFLEWERVETLLAWDEQMVFEGEKYIVGGGRVRRYKKSWWMERWARKKEVGGGGAEQASVAVETERKATATGNSTTLPPMAPGPKLPSESRISASRPDGELK